MERRPVMAGNWKMHKTPSEGAAFVAELAERLGSAGDVQVVVAPPFTGLPAAVESARGTGIEVAAQDVFWEEQGAYTGEVSVGMLADVGVGLVIVGHSERRAMFGDTDDAVARKVRAILDGGMVPIVCVGETQDERESGRTEERLMQQVAGSLEHVRPEEFPSLIVAYEPVWAIGTGRTATPGMAQEAMSFIRSRLADVCGDERAARTRILYGGSVKPGNVTELMAEPDVDGGLVGGASLEVDSFARLVGYRS